MFAPFILLGVILFALLIIFYFVPLGLWIQAIVSVGLGEITIVDLIRMRLRKIPPRLIVDSIINLNKAGLESISTGMRALSAAMSEMVTLGTCPPAR